MQNYLVVLDVIAGRFSFTWARGTTMSEARKEFRKHAGRFPSAKAVWYFVPDCEPEKEPWIDEMGTLHYPQDSKTYKLN